MKKFIGILAVMFILMSFSTLVTQKIGYCDIQQIIPLMPDYEQAKAKLEAQAQDYQNQLEEMQVEFNNKYKDYTDNAALDDNDPKKWSPAIQKMKEQELTDLQQRIQDFQMTIQQELQDSQVKLLSDIQAKVDSVIDVVIQENNYWFVIENTQDIRVNKNLVDDVSPVVKQKLGLQ